jgi:exoribonuclease R
MSSIQGILQTKDYDSFIILSDTGDKLYDFTGSKKANKCLPGDHVFWNTEKGYCELELRNELPLIVGTLELTNKSKYGLTSRGIPIYLFTPYDKRFPHFIVGSSEKDISHNKIALIKFDVWAKNATFPRGQLQQILGNSGEYEAELQALIWQASPLRYPKGEWIPKTKETHERQQIKWGTTFNIDPDGCKDIDDVLTFEEVDGGWRVIITISDVARYIEDGSVEDIYASLIGQTLYLDGKVERPMLPIEYSEKVCSLLPNKKSYGVSLSFVWNELGISDLEWFESEFENNKSYTYEQFQQNSFDNYRDGLQKVASYLAGKEIYDSHKWIEECMKFYNIEAAKLLKQQMNGILRRHSKPNLEKLEKYKKLNESMGVDLEKLAYQSAEYCLADEDNTLHYGLETNTYTHATSPIRRYVDLVNQRIIKSVIQKNNGKLEENRYIIPLATYDINQREKAIKRFDRDLIFLRSIQESQYKSHEGLILDIEENSEKQTIKLHLYVEEWKRIISAEYKSPRSGIILSRDEKQEFEINELSKVNFMCAFNTNARNWKERIIIQIINTL